MSPQMKPHELAGLPIDERLALVEAIWNSIAEQDDLVPMPDWHGEELDRRVARHAEKPLEGAEWEEMRERLLAKLVK